MSKLDQLIAELCPEGVKHMALGGIVVRTKGTPITATRMKELDKPNAPIKIFAGGKTVAYFDFTDLPEKDINTYPSVIVKSRGVIEFEYHDKPFSHKNEMWSYHSERDDVDIKYLYYFLKTQEDRLREKATSMGAFPQISIHDTEKLQIPLPPLLIQREIVRILDNFTELTARKKQYEYYRNELLTFGDDVPMVMLEEVAEMLRGTYATQKSMKPGNVPVMLGGQEPAYYCDTSNHDGEAIVMSRSGAYAGFVSYWNEPIFVTDGFCFETKKEMLLKFLYYFLKNMQDALHDMKRGGGVPHVRGAEILKLKIPVPSLTEQARIVAILDKFDTLTTDITDGLPAEIEARNSNTNTTMTSCSRSRRRKYERI